MRGRLLFLPLAARRSGLRGRFPAPAATALVTGLVAACVAATVAFVRRHPAAADALPPGTIAVLVVVLVGCLWRAMAPPLSSVGSRAGRGRFGGSRLAPYLGVAAAFVFALGVLAFSHAGRGGWVPVWLLYGPMLTFVFPAFIVAAADRSFRAGLRAGIWTAITVMPLTFALLLAEASRRYANDGAWLFAGDVTTAGFTLRLALLIVCAVPLIGFPFAIIGAAVGTRYRGTGP